MAAFLGHVGGREIDGDAAGGQRQAGGDQRRAHPFAGLGHRLVGQPDDGESGQAGRDLHLHVDRAGLDPLKGYGGNPLDHARPSLRGTRVMELGDEIKNIKGTCEGCCVVNAAHRVTRSRSGSHIDGPNRRLQNSV